MPAPIPLPNETQQQYAVRAHQQLMAEVPVTDDRNRAVFDTWRKYRGDGPVEQMAAKKGLTNRSKFMVERDVPVFEEHNTYDDQGNPQDYDLKALCAIADRNNLRAVDRGMFAALCDGHTPSREEKSHGAKDPEVLGFVGNYKLGMVGNVNPTWTLFQDEYRYSDRAEYTSRHPYRSVEIWLHSDMGQRYFHPVAALGADAPRLDLPMTFSQDSSGVRIARYSATHYSALPGGNTGFVPSALSKERYSDMAISPEDAQMIAQAVVQALKSVPSDAPPAADPAAPPAAPPVAPPADPAAPPVDDNQRSAYETAEEDPTTTPDIPASEPEADDPEKMSKADLVQKYRAARQAEKPLKESYARLKRQVADLESKQAERDSERLEAIKSAEYAKLFAEGYVFDTEKEAKLTAKYSEDQFFAHCNDVIRANYQRTDGRIKGGRMPVPHSSAAERSEDEKAKYAAREAAERVKVARRDGKDVKYQHALKEVQKELGIAS